MTNEIATKSEEVAKLEENVAPYRVLTIDGGGMRGLYTAILVDTLAKRFADDRNVGDLDVGKAFDLIVGTSTGAILGTLLAVGVPTYDIVQLYRDLGPKTFRDPVPTGYNHLDLIPALWRWVWRNWKKPANQPDALIAAMQPLLGEMTFKELYEKRGIGLCIPTVNMATHKGVMIKTPHNPHRKRDNGYKLADIIIASTSAPILFPITTVDDPNDPEDYKAFIDGGLWANNPVLIGMAEALRMRQPKRPIEILSLGACTPPTGTFVSKGRTNWGLKEWRAGTRVLSLALETQSTAYNQMASIIAKYLRRPCKVIRLPQSAPSAEQERYTLMDMATPRTLKVLSDLAKYDADYVYSMVMERSDEELLPVDDIFASMPVLNKP